MTETIQELASELQQRLYRVSELAKQLEGRLRSSDPTLLAAPEAIYIKDRHGRVILRNRAYFPEFPELIGMRGVDFLPGGFKGICQLTDEFVIRLRQPVLYTHGNPRDPGSGELFQSVKVPLCSVDGELQGILGIMSPLRRPAPRVENSFEQSSDTLYMEMRPELWAEVHQAHAKLRELSARQKSVVAMISEGLKQEAISRRLDISRKTVEKHREAASKKLEARSYAELIRLATLGQIISPLDYEVAVTNSDQVVSEDCCDVLTDA